MDGQSPLDILIVRPSALGDVCRTVPVLASLRRAKPTARIDWLVQDGFVDAVRAHPDLDEAIAFPRGRFARWWRHPRTAVELARWLRDLRGRRYDLVIDCQGLGRSGLITRVTGAARRIGPRGARELGWLGYTDRRQIEPDQHTVDEMLALLAPLEVPPIPDMRLYAPSEDTAWWRERRVSDGLSDGRYAVLAPTTRWPSKRWPGERWSELVAPLRDRELDRIVVVAAPGEDEQVRPVLEGLRAAAPAALVDLAGRTSVGRTMAVIADAGLVVANDSAPLHMAVGFDRPTVGLFGPTDPRRVGPYPPAHPRREVVRSADADADVSFKRRALGDRMMRSISVDRVVAAIDRVAAAAPVRDGMERATP